MLNLTEAEMTFLLKLLDQANPPGIPNKKIVISIMDKIAGALRPDLTQKKPLPPNAEEDEIEEEPDK